MKQNRTLRILLLSSFLLLSFFLAAVIYNRYSGNVEPQTPPPVPESKADLSITTFHYSESRDGVTLWELNADSAEHDLARGETRIKGIRATFYNHNTGDKVELTAARGVWLGGQRQLRVEKDVVVKNAAGYACYADNLVYSEADSHLRTDGPVRLESDQAEVEAVGLDIDLKHRTLHLLADVRSSWQIAMLLKEKR